jgi:hypothetical protein
MLLVAMFLAVYWAFGGRVLCVALVFWGCQYPASYGWTGGAFLRHDWIFWLVVTVCLLKRGWHGTAGAAFAYSTLLRVFPGVLLAGPVALAGWHFWRHRHLASSHRRMAAGGLLATAVLVVASLATFGAGSYKDFWHHIQLYNATPLPNRMGLKTIFSYSLDGRMQLARDPGPADPFSTWLAQKWGDETWKEKRRERFATLEPAYLVAVVSVLAATVYALRRVRSLWISLPLSLALCVSVAELTNYHYSMFVLTALLARISGRFERAALFVAGLSQLLASGPLWTFDDDRYMAQSVLFVAYALACVLSVGLERHLNPFRSRARW